MIKLYDGWQKFIDDTLAVTGKIQKGTVNWMNIWHPEKCIPSRTIFPASSPPRCTGNFSSAELVKEIDYLDASIYHLDGEECLQHLDILLEIPNLNAIQWVRGARNDDKPIEKWLPLYQKMQAKKKAIIVYPRPHEVQLVLDNLKPEGLLIQTWAKDVEEAKDLMKRCGWK